MPIFTQRESEEKGELRGKLNQHQDPVKIGLASDFSSESLTNRKTNKRAIYRQNYEKVFSYLLGVFTLNQQIDFHVLWRIRVLYSKIVENTVLVCVEVSCVCECEVMSLTDVFNLVQGTGNTIVSDAP